MQQRLGLVPRGEVFFIKYKKKVVNSIGLLVDEWFQIQISNISHYMTILGG